MKNGILMLACCAVLTGCAQRQDDSGMGNAPFTTSTGAGAGSFGGGSETGQQSSSGAALPKRDVTFMETASRLGNAEVQLAQVAMQNGVSQSVKDYAQHLITDHTQSNQELMNLANSKGLAAPTAPDRKHQRALEKLSQLQGNEFDRAFQKQAIADHELQIKMYQTAAERCQDPDVKSFAQRNVPILQHHLEMARAMRLEQTAAASSR